LGNGRQRERRRLSRKVARKSQNFKTGQVKGKKEQRVGDLTLRGVVTIDSGGKRSKAVSPPWGKKIKLKIKRIAIRVGNRAEGKGGG